MKLFTASIILFLFLLLITGPGLNVNGRKFLPKNEKIAEWIKSQKSQLATNCHMSKGKNILEDTILSCLRLNSPPDSFNCCWNAILNQNTSQPNNREDVNNFNCKYEYWSEIKVLLANCLLHDHQGQNFNSILFNSTTKDTIDLIKRKKQIEICIPGYVLSFITFNDSSTAASKSHVETLTHVTSVISIESDPKYTNHDLHCPKDVKSGQMCEQERLYREKMHQICAHPHHQQQKHPDADLIEAIERKKCLANHLNDSQFEGLNLCWHLVTGQFYPENVTQWRQFLCNRKSKPEQLLKIIDECFKEFQVGHFALDLTSESNNHLYSNETTFYEASINCSLSEYIFDTDKGPLEIHRRAYSLVKQVYLAEKHLQLYCHSNDTQLVNTLASSVNCNNNNSKWTSDQSLFVNSVIRFCWKYTLDTKFPSSGSEWKNFFCCQSTDSRTKMAALLDQCFTQVTVNLLHHPSDEMLHQLSKCSVSLVDPFGKMSLVSK